ncbi:MAG TPA: serine/threonine-protein kinase [Gemmatimonadaceae bacterium]|nr:serine/threonine-protein kinase [Gemmatimonadaceae bacterium]
MSTRCPACGAEYPADARFCPRDGTRLEPVAAPGADAAPPPSHARVFESISPAEARATTPRLGGAAPPFTPPVDVARLPGQVLDGRYRVTRKIGEGGMSFVFLASDASTGENVAIKLLSPSLIRDRNAMARLRREAELGGRLAHPNVCHIMRLGETAQGLVYVVMPFIEGELLCDRNIRLGQLPLDVTTRFVSDIAAGLHVAHALGIIHRDLKPENIMICRRPDGSEHAVVMDFGLAKERQLGPEVQKLTATGIVLGTPEFMSPEQLRGKTLDPRTDIYSLGLMACEMLTGQLPFTGRTQQDVMLARLKSEPTPIRAVRPDLHFPAAVEQVLLKSMHRDPDHRYRTAPEFAAALADAAAGGSGGEGPSASAFLDRLLRR